MDQQPESGAVLPSPSSPADAGAPLSRSSPPANGRPSYVFFGVVAAVALMADVASKAWAEITLTARPRDPAIKLVENHLSLNLAYNRGGAWGLLQNASELVRRPFFLCVSVAAVIFIVSLYSRLLPGQRALKWGLPLVLGGALGNLTDRVVRTSVVDFIDYRAEWITKMNEGIAAVVPTWNVTDHWPTFNVADMCICAGVALMAIDMIASRHPPKTRSSEPSAATAS
ncbi:MAG TPA: signal peptidase II [Polyangiaceae bacterium]|nr:signal peptidase II [Polyangiaceae bacterium]